MGSFWTTVWADDESWKVVKIANPSPLKGDLNSNLHLILSGLIKLAIPFLVLAFVYIGFLFAKAQGEPKELEKVRTYFIWAVLGALIILGADLILSMIEDTVKSSALFE